MTTKEKCLVMMRKAAAAKRLNDKIMTKRAEYRAQMQPSEAYIAGFCKAAEAYGVDPEELLKEAQWLKSIGKGIVGGAKALGNAALGGAKMLGNGYARLAGGAAGALTGKGWQAGAQAGSNLFNKGVNAVSSVANKTMGAMGNMASKGMGMVNRGMGMANNAVRGFLPFGG